MYTNVKSYPNKYHHFFIQTIDGKFQSFSFEIKLSKEAAHNKLPKDCKIKSYSTIKK